MKKAVIPKLFRDDLDANLDSLHREFNCREFRREVMAITPRRYGKTWSVAMFAAAAAFALEESEQAIFSTGRRASRRLLDLVYRFVSALPGFEKSWVVRNNQEELWLNLGDGTLRKINSYPSKEEVCFFFCADVVVAVGWVIGHFFFCVRARACSQVSIDDQRQIFVGKKCPRERPVSTDIGPQPTISTRTYAKP